MGCLVKVGGSAAFAYLQMTRSVVETVVGESPFCNDRDQQRFFEPPREDVETSVDERIIPGKGVAEVLAQSFFANLPSPSPPFPTPFPLSTSSNPPRLSA